VTVQATERLDLVPLTVEDADEIVGVLADERLYDFIGGAPPSLKGPKPRFGAESEFLTPFTSAARKSSGCCDR
jgi:hypothetical protein